MKEVFNQYMGNTSVKNVNLSEIDPYQVFDIPKDFTWEQLKNAYKKAALQTHPDKTNGNRELFDFVTSSFEKLALEYKARNSNKSHQELKKHSQEYYSNINHDTIVQHEPEYNNSQPFITKFNQAFDKFKYHDESIDSGYGDIMAKSNDIREDINVENIFSKKNVDNSTFNDIFNKKIPVSKQLTKYQEPAPLLMAKKIQFTEIGSAKSDDYSGATESKSLAFTDYMKAHSGERLADPNSSFKEYNSVKDYQKYREKKTKASLTDKEKARLERQKLKEEKEELDRLERVQNKDFAIQKAHEKANQFLIR